METELAGKLIYFFCTVSCYETLILLPYLAFDMLLKEYFIFQKNNKKLKVNIQLLCSL